MVTTAETFGYSQGWALYKSAELKPNNETFNIYVANITSGLRRNRAEQMLKPNTSPNPYYSILRRLVTAAISELHLNVSAEWHVHIT